MADTRTRPLADRVRGREPADRRAPDAAQRSRRRFARRQWARRWLRWRRVLAALVVLLVVGGGVWAVYFSSWLAVEGVDVVGTETLSADQVRAAADVETGGPLATADLDAIATRVRSLASVDHVDVSREWPHQVRIEVTERTPVAVVDVDGQLRSLDQDGVVFGSYPRPPSGLPLVQSGGGATSDALEEAAKVAAALPAPVRTLTDHIEVATVDQITLALDDGRTVRWGSAEASSRKADVLLALLDRPAATYDVSVPGRPTTSGAAPAR